MTIEDREQQDDFPLTHRWGPVKTIGTRTRIAGYDDGLAIEIDGSVWKVPIVQQLDKFR